MEDRLHAEASIGLLEDLETSCMKNESGYAERLSRRAFKHRFAPRILRAVDTLGRACILLLPSFVASRADAVKSTSVVRKSRPTAYLDGLRGVAAWTVVNCHLMHILSTDAGVGFGHPGIHHAIYKLPLVRVIGNGDWAVSVFFIVGGYASSITPVLAMKNPSRDSASAMKKLASSLVRRPVRLFLPCFATTFLVFVLIRVGYFEYFIAREKTFQTHYRGWASLKDEWPARLPSFAAQLQELLWTDLRFFSLFSAWQVRPWFTPYTLPTWTIPLEYRSSLVLYLTHAALFYVQRKSKRVALAGALIIMGLCLKAFDLPLFWSGYVLAELSPLLGTEHTETKRNIVSTLSMVLCLIAGLYCASFPGWGAQETPGFGWLDALSPWNEYADRWWWNLGAVLVIFSLDRLKTPRDFLCWGPVEYLGKISFSLYLMHFWIMHTMGEAIFHYAYSISGVTGVIPRLIGFFLGYFVLLAVLAWIADVFWRCVDTPCVSLAFKLERWLFEK